MAVTGKMLGAQKRLVSTAPVNVNTAFRQGTIDAYNYYGVMPKIIVLQDYICAISSSVSDRCLLNITAYKIVNGAPVYVTSKTVTGDFRSIGYCIPYAIIRGGQNSLLLISGDISQTNNILTYSITVTDTQITMGEKYIICTDAITGYYSFDCCYLTGNIAFLVYTQRKLINGSTNVYEHALRAMTITTSNGYLSLGTPVMVGLPDSSKVTPRNYLIQGSDSLIICTTVSTSKVIVMQPSTAGGSVAIMPVTVSGTTLSAQPPNYSVSMGATNIFGSPVTSCRYVRMHGNCIATSGCMYIYSFGQVHNNNISKVCSAVFCLDASSYECLGVFGEQINTMWVENDVAYFYDYDRSTLYKASSTDKQNCISMHQNLLPLNSKDFILGFSKGMAVIVHQENPSYAYLTAVKANFNGSSLTRIADNTALVSGESGKTKQISSLYFDTPNTNDYFLNKVQFLLNGTPFYTQTVTQSEKMLLPNCPIILNPSDVLKVQTTTGVSDMYVTAFGLEETV